MTGTQVDRLALVGLAFVSAVAFGLLIRRRPVVGLVAFIGSVALVPYWMGVTVSWYFPPATAAALLSAAALIGVGSLRLGLVDLCLAGVGGLVVLMYLAGFVGFGEVFDVLVAWGSAYLAGRILVSVLGGDAVYLWVSRAFVLVAVLGLLEAATRRNLFVELLARGNSFYATWGPLQERGGLLRVEGAFGHSIALGVSLALAIPFVLAARISSRAKAVGVTLVLAATVLTLSRLGIACAVIALILSLLVMTDRVQPRIRRGLGVGLVAGAGLVLPFIAGVFSDAGDEASESADYREQLTVLIPEMRFVGTSDALQQTADGRAYFGAFRSIDSELILIGLRFGIIVLVVLAALYVAALVAAFRRPANPGAIAVAASLPALTSVAFITQYTTFLWFVAGVAVTVGTLRSTEETTLFTGVRAGPSTEVRGSGQAGLQRLFVQGELT